MMRASRIFLAAPSVAYHDQVASRKLRSDPRQVDALQPLDRLYHDIMRLHASGIPRRDLALTPAPKGGAAAGPSRGSAPPSPSSGGFFSRLTGSSNAASSSSSQPLAGVTKLKRSNTMTHPLSQLKGLYLHGDVGCGKTHMMDMLYYELPAGIAKKRVHFHQFMQSVHKDMHAIKQVHGKTMDGNELMRELAIKQVQDAEVLCFDELVVADVADAMILRRLFENMYYVGVCTVFTSNRPPRELYKDGLNRGSFLPFIDLLQERCYVHNMSSGTDHRLAGTVADSYLHPIDGERRQVFDAHFADLTRGKPSVPKTLRVYGRDVVVKQAVGGVCRYTFRDLCGTAMSVADYSEIAKNFHTMFLEDVPRLAAGNSDTKRRFISLLDELYQYKVKLYVLADAAPERLEMPPEGSELARADSNEESAYAGQLINSGEDMFQMRRCVSRLQEMRSREYAKQPYMGTAPP
jgi:protein AFG1